MKKKVTTECKVQKRATYPRQREVGTAGILGASSPGSKKKKAREKQTVDEEGVLIPGGSAQQKERMAAPRCALKIHCNHLEEDVVMTFNKQVKKQAKIESRRFAQRLHQERKSD